MRNTIPILVLALATLTAPVAAASKPPPAPNLQSRISNLRLTSQISNVRSEIRNPKSEKPVRELFVPFEDLSVLLQGDPNRVLLPRAEYDALLEKARKEAQARPPRQALLVSADYDARVGDERTEITGTLAVSVLEDGLHAVGLDVGGVGLRSATLDGKGAPVGLADDGRLTLFVRGKGEHKLVLDVVAPLQTTAARQILTFRLPTPAPSRMRLTVPGDVEVKSGAPVVTRVFDEATEVTRIEILPARGDVSLVMTLNSRLLRKDRIVVARSVFLDEVTQAYERLHATVSMGVLHRAVNGFRFAIPAGFEVTDVRSPNLARWAIVTEGNRRILDIRLRDETTETVVLNLSAVRMKPDLESWALAKLEPLDVVGHVAVVGLAVEDRLKAEVVSPEGLIPIDTTVLVKALPATVLEARPGAARIRPVAAYYAPQGAFGLSARFVKPPARLRVTTNLLAILEDGGLTVRGGFALVPEEEKHFTFDFSVPAGWDVTGVTADGGGVTFERYGKPGQDGRVHVRLEKGIPAGSERQVLFTAVHVPKTWFGEWNTTAVEFPVFAVSGAARDVGAVAVDARDDMVVRPETLERLMPLDENEKTRYGLQGVAAALAYRYDAQPYRARLTVERTLPRITAQTFSFFRVERDVLAAHYEIVYDVTQARTRRLLLLLPEDTPTALSIRGLDGVALKEYTSETVGEEANRRRRWTALLAERRSGTVRLAVDFQQRLAELEPENLALPIIEADGVAYQSGLVAVEGSPELDVVPKTEARKVDIGELVDAEYQPGRRLLGAYGFVGDPPPVKASVARHPALGLPPAIVQRAELDTVLSADGLAQTSARFLLRTKALFLEVRLPKGSSLWSADLDGTPIKPQREQESMLLNLPAAAAGAVRDLRVVYETPVAGMGFWKGLDVPAPRLFLRAGLAGEDNATTQPAARRPSQAAAKGAGTGPAASQAKSREVPLADLVWQLFMPTGYQVVRTEGSVVTDQVAAPPLAVANVAGAFYTGSGGVDFEHGALGLFMPSVYSAMERASPKAQFADSYGFEPEEGEAGSATDFSITAGATEEGFGEKTSRRRRAGGEKAADEVTRKDLAALSAKPERPTAESKPAEKPQPSSIVRQFKQITVPDVASNRLAQLKPPAPPKKPVAPAKKEDAKKKKLKRAWALEGVTSLKIDLVKTGEAVTFQSLGTEPRLTLTVVDAGRTRALAWALALAVFVVGLALTLRPVAVKATHVVGVALVATLIPVITGRIELAMVVNGAFYAACLLIPYYLLAGCTRWFAGKVGAVLSPQAPAAAGLLIVIAAGAMLASGASAAPADKGAPYVIQVVPPPEPVKVPADAIILPYDPASKTGIKDADRLLVPYARYVELWNQAYPDKPIGEKKPPAPYALAGAALAATLTGDEFLLVEGHIDIDVYTDSYAVVPLPLEGGVLAKADLDGAPARLSVAQAAPAPKKKSSKPAPKAFIVLYVSGKGRHRLEVAVRMRMQRRGGWRVVEGRLPVAPATALALTVPDAETEVRLAGVPDRTSYETKAAGEAIQTALSAGGSVSIQWRPKVSEGQIDQTLTASSKAVLDVQEDSLRLVWAVHLEFRHGERDFFTVEVPAGYTVEKVEGTNVRGWELKAADNGQEVTVTLLKRAKAAEDFTVTTWRQADAGGLPMAGGEFDAPVIAVTGAQRHTGGLVIRRSPLLDLRTVRTAGVRRDDLPADPKKVVPGAGQMESPLGIRPFQAYRFVATPFSVRLAATPTAAEKTADVQMIVRVAERERSMEARATLTVRNRPLYWARFVVPADLRLDRVVAPGTFEWALTDEANRKVLTVYLASGVQGACPILIQGKLGEDQKALETAVPHIEVLDVERQQGDIVVQADPAFEVRTEDLRNVERVLLARVSGWLGGDQKGLAALALHYTRPDYAGQLVLTARRPDVTCFTVTNARVTDRSIDETVLISWTIRGAGIREVSFLVPAWMKDARISVPLLRQKTVTPVAEDESRVRVRLELQDEVMDELRVLVENDRLLSGGTHDVPIPTVETGRTDRRYVALESAGRDEVLVETRDGLDPLSRQQKEWATVAGMLRGGMTQAFIVSAGAEAPRLAFQTKQRAAVETVGARIGLAQTDLVMDSSGAYRARQTYHVDNRIEQFLVIELPEGAALWTAVVAGRPVKPTRMDGTRQVRVPIVKTAEGDLDYTVILKYGGRIASLGAMAWSVDFPIIQPVNIRAELSQVRLYVPETHRWFHFDGMSPVTEEGTFEAGVLAYRNKLAGRLVQTLQSDNPFAQTRARSNLVSIAREINEYQVTLGNQDYDNETLQTEISNAAVVLKNVDKEIQVQEQAQQVDVAFNDDLIREVYEGQRNRRARNLVQDLDLNWKDAQQQPAQPAPDQVGFNAAWLGGNELLNTAAEAQQAKGGARFQVGGQQGAAVQQRTRMPQSQAAGQMFQKFAGKDLADRQQMEESARKQQRRLSQTEVVERYQQKLQQRAELDKAQLSVRGTTVTTGRPKIHGGAEFSGIVRDGRVGGGRSVSASTWGREAGAATAGTTISLGGHGWVERDGDMPAGLASLDVQLPQRGRLYRFTTLEKKIGITARSASLPLIEGAERVAGVAVLLVAIALVRRWLRGRSFDLRTQSVFSTVLIVLGVIGVALGIFPVAGLLALAVGIGMKIKLFYARRRPAAG